MLNKIPKANILIMGAYLKASIGTRLNDANDNKDPSVGLFSPHGNPWRNARGEFIIRILTQFQMRAASTFFESSKGHDTWINPAMKVKYQLDHFLIKKKHLQIITDVKRKDNGIPSDHTALCIKLKFPNVKLTPRKKQMKTMEVIMRVNNHILREAGGKLST